jgi:hypothetical protein
MTRAVQRALILFSMILLFAAPARADGLVYRVDGCGDHIFVSSADGYSVLVSSGAHEIKNRDELAGSVERVGSRMILDRTNGRSLFALVTEVRLSKSEADQRIAIRCRSPLADAFTTGRVLRICGNTIFVNTEKGYAVLERMAGGMVANDDSLSGNFNRPGRTTVQNKQSNASLTVFVQALWLSKSAAQSRIAAICR